MIRALRENLQTWSKLRLISAILLEEAYPQEFRQTGCGAVKCQEDNMFEYEESVIPTRTGVFHIYYLALPSTQITRETLIYRFYMTSLSILIYGIAIEFINILQEKLKKNCNSIQFFISYIYN